MLIELLTNLTLPEIRAFADSIVNGGRALARFTSQRLDGAIVTATFEGPVRVVKGG